MIDRDRLMRALETARLDLLMQRESAGHWAGELATRALSTATAVSALSLIERQGPTDAEGRFPDEAYRSDLSRRIVRGLNWLADHQNADGGWGDTDKSYSNIATTMLAVAAFHMAGFPADHEDLLQRAEDYIKRAGGVEGLRRRYGKDKTFSAPILTNCALAEIVPWRQVSTLPFELACVPQRFYRFLRLPVVSYAIPALVAIGQCRYFHKKPVNPITRFVRALSVGRSLDVIDRMQPASGGYLEAIPLTSFVVMSLASTGRVDHPVTQRGKQFLLDTMRPDGSWPIDTNLATWNTSLALAALSEAGEDIAELGCTDWLLSCQHREQHPFTGADPGGWGWSDLSGAVPDADDTPGALLALCRIARSPQCRLSQRERITQAARSGVRWLLDLQNNDHGWPTFCRGWGLLPFDRSGADLTAHAVRALYAWRHSVAADERDAVNEAIRRGFLFLETQQQTDGSWLPLWFGNQDHPNEANPVYGTAKVLAAYRDLGRWEEEPPRRAVRWLAGQQNRDGGFGGGRAILEATGGARESSVEETALAVEALLAEPDPSLRPTITRGLEWLLESVEDGRHAESSPIGFYFAKLWYYEKLYPLTFTVSALGRAASALPHWPEPTPAAARR